MPYCLCLAGYSGFNLQISQEGIAPISSTGRWRCLVCFKEFKLRSSACRHYNDAHLTTQPLRCQFCNLESKNTSSLRQHLRTTHGITQNDLKNRFVPSKALQGSGLDNSAV